MDEITGNVSRITIPVRSPSRLHIQDIFNVGFDRPSEQLHRSTISLPAAASASQAVTDATVDRVALTRLTEFILSECSEYCPTSKLVNKVYSIMHSLVAYGRQEYAPLLEKASVRCLDHEKQSNVPTSPKVPLHQLSTRSIGLMKSDSSGLNLINVVDVSSGSGTLDTTRHSQHGFPQTTIKALIALKRLQRKIRLRCENRRNSLLQSLELR